MTDLTGLPANFNATLLNNPDLCTLQTCPLSLAHIRYIPNLAGNGLYAAIFGLALIGQVILALKYKTLGYSIAMVGGLVLEIVGYVGRIQLHSNPFTKGPFIMYLVCLTIGPAFLSAAVYLCLSRIVVVYSESVSRFRPATYTVVFIVCDIIALLLQAAGGGIAAVATTVNMDNIGKNILVAGVSWQVGSLVLFATLCLDFARRVRNAPKEMLNSETATFRRSKTFRAFLSALTLAALTIFVRSVFRCAELSSGFNSPLANQQVTFMVLEGAMICTAAVCLTAFHPGVMLGKYWQAASWTIRPKSTTAKTAMDSETALWQSAREDGVPEK